MRHIFDQYEQPENRLTHALACCLNEDRKLLRRFLKWAFEWSPPTGEPLHVEEQTLPGEPDMSELEAEQRGLPDVWIHDGKTRCALIESKVADPISEEQLRRHQETAENRGFKQVQLLALTVLPPKNLREAKTKTWAEIYAWSRGQSHTSEWARQMATYMEVAERRMIERQYLKKGTLTKFTGIPYSRKIPYSDQEAKRVLRLAMDKLRGSAKLQRELGVSPSPEGRPAITQAWDVLPLGGPEGNVDFTKCPHLTLSLEHDRAWVMAVIPNAIRTDFRRNLVKLRKKRFIKVVQEIEQEIEQRLGLKVSGLKGISPRLEISQQHYLGQKRAVADAKLELDLRTAAQSPARHAAGGVKPQPEWIDAAYAVFVNKQSNIQLAVGAVFWYGDCEAIQNEAALDLFEETWLACKPLLDVVFGRK